MNLKNGYLSNEYDWYSDEAKLKIDAACQAKADRYMAGNFLPCDKMQDPGDFSISFREGRKDV